MNTIKSERKAKMSGYQKARNAREEKRAKSRENSSSVLAMDVTLGIPYNIFLRDE